MLTKILGGYQTDFARNWLKEGASIVDAFKEQGLHVFGPDAYCSQLESSKVFARDIMAEYNIPHPKYYACKDREEAIDAKKILGLPIVLKADGLAAGKGVVVCSSIEEALKNADFIQECATENYAIKTKLMKTIGNYAKPNAIISSSSSGLLPTRIYLKCKNPARTMIGHPFNPVYMCPGVEIVPGKKTKKIFLNKANKFYKSISMNPIMVKKELPGYLADRLQEALWREALHIVNEGYASTKDLDRAIEDGPGLRWSLMGIFLTYHLAGGKAGMKHMLEQFGPALKLPWTKLKAPKLSKKLSSRVISGTRQQAKGKSVAMISNIRDEYLVNLQKLRKKYENKIRK